MSLYTRDKACYVFSVPSGYVKIGISDDPVRRRNEVQSYCYEPVEFVGGTEISQGSPVPAAVFEQLTHLKLKAYAGERREWFKIDLEAAVTIWQATYWFLAIPPGHPDLERVQPNWDSTIRAWEKQKKRA